MGRKRNSDDNSTNQPSGPQFDIAGPFMDPCQEREPVENVDDSSSKKCKTQDSQLDSGLSLPDMAHSVSDMPTQQPQTTPTPVMQDVFKGATQQDQMLQMTWSQMFRDSENHELFWPTRLDKTLQEAKNLEQNLLQQKEVLRSRLHGLSQTLQL